jgi:hypothetical protein
MITIWNRKKEEVYNKWKQYWFNTHPIEIAEYSWNYLFSGGKQIRPTLFCELQYYLSLDYNKINAEIAFAIECIHVASIILDDTPWMDNADLRRGKVTLHKYFTPKKACLIAYDLLYLAINIWKLHKPSYISEEEWGKLLKEKLQRLMIGQWYDLDKKGNLIDLASLKTGVLFELVSETVAVLENLDRQFWRNWGNNLGVLFQWVDDWDDREEDRIQGNRNAFNEDYEFTLKNYYYLWDSLKGIGKEWFESDFGKYMESYFTPNGFPKQIPSYLGLDLKYLEKVEIPDDLGYSSNSKLGLGKEFQFINGKDMIKVLWKYIEKQDSCPDYSHLWNKQEYEWDNPFKI